MIYNDFQKIPQITQANYKIDVFWLHFEEQIKQMSDGVELVIEPEFQRAHVWTDEQRTKYIEWILRGGKSGKDILWNCAGWMGKFTGPLYLVDGLQRITAVRKFLNNEIPVFGTLYKDFSSKPNMLRCGFIFYVNDLKNYTDVLKWYLAINSGGTIHTEEEIEKVKILLEKEKMNITSKS